MTRSGARTLGLLGMLLTLAGASGCAVTGGGSEAVGTSSAAVTYSRAHLFNLGMEGTHDSTAYEHFRGLESAAIRNQPRLCHVYTPWNITDDPPLPAGANNDSGTQTLTSLMDWFTLVNVGTGIGNGANSNCDEVMVTFKGEGGTAPEAVPNPTADFEPKVSAFLKLLKPGGKLEGWNGKISFTPWNEPNNSAGDGNGLGNDLPPETAAEYYLIASNLCADSAYKCKVAAGDFATNTPWGDNAAPTDKNAGSIEQNCADDEDGLTKDGSTWKCKASSSYNPHHWDASYLDRYKFYIAQHGGEKDSAGKRVYPNLADNVRPRYWAYHPWHDVNSYLDTKARCEDYDDCVTRRLLVSLTDSWAGTSDATTEIWDTEISVGQQNKTALSNGEQACGAAFLMQLTDLDPKITRLYYEWYGYSFGALLEKEGDGGLEARSAGNIIKDEQLTDPGGACSATGMEPVYTNPIIPMFKLPADEIRGAVTEHDTEGCPDPTGLKAHTGEYYIYCTSYSLQSRRLGGFPIFESSSLGGPSGNPTWKRPSRVGSIITPSKSYETWPNWIQKGNGDFWAPDVHEVKINGEYVYVALYAAPHDYYYKHEVKQKDGTKKDETVPGSMQSIGLSWSTEGPSGPWTHQDTMLISACNSDNANCKDATSGHPKPVATRDNGSTETTGTYDPNLLVTYDKNDKPVLYLYWTVAGDGVWAQAVDLVSPKKGVWELKFTGKDPVHVSAHGEGAYAFERSSDDTKTDCDGPGGAGTCYFLFYSTSADPANSLLYTYQVYVQRTANNPLASESEWALHEAKNSKGDLEPVPVVQKSANANGSLVTDKAFVGTGGNSVIHDAVGTTDYLVYHAILVPRVGVKDECVDIEDPSAAAIKKSSTNPYCRGQGERQAMIDPIDWSSGWPVVNGTSGRPSTGPVTLP